MDGDLLGEVVEAQPVGLWCRGDADVMAVGVGGRCVDRFGEVGGVALGRHGGHDVGRGERDRGGVGARPSQGERVGVAPGGGQDLDERALSGMHACVHAIVLGGGVVDDVPIGEGCGAG